MLEWFGPHGSALRTIMLKRILLALDLTPASLRARRYALDLAARHGAAVLGLVIIDPEIVAPPELTPMGADFHKQHKDSVLLQKAQADAEAVAGQFSDDCRRMQVSGEAKIAVGPALQELVAASDLYDLIAAGVDTAFDAAAPETVGRVIAGLLRDNSRPVLAMPRHEESAFGQRTLVAYGGSVAAMRAVQIFCCSRINTKQETIVATVHSNAATAARLSERGAQYVREHGYNAQARAIVSDDDVTALLLGAAKDVQANIIVAGAYGHQGWRQWLMGTTTKRLLEQSSVPLFIHH